MSSKRYVIVDVETTGIRSGEDQMTEIGMVLFDGEVIIETYQSFINPGCAIPSNITALTGISNEMVADAPKFHEIAKDIVEFTKGAIFVAHNARFDYGFIQQAFRSLGYNFSKQQLCTVKLARKVFPGLGSYSLRNLTIHFDIEVNRRHRALDDAIATTQLLKILFQQQKSGDLAYDIIHKGVKEAKLPPGISLDHLHALPEACGVYYFHNDRGDVVYVGKSLNIQKRVFSHFSKDTPKSHLLYEHVRSFSYEVTGSELVALLLESEEIKSLSPFINRSQRRVQFPYIIHARWDDNRYRHLEVLKTKLTHRKKLEYIAEYPTLSSAKGYLLRAVNQFELCRRLTNLESKVGSCLYYQMDMCGGACMQKEMPDPYNRRVADAIEMLKIGFKEDFFLVDVGRTPQERAVVLIENGIYRGFGYIDETTTGINTDLLRQSIQIRKNNPDVLRIIRHFVAKENDIQQVFF